MRPRDRKCKAYIFTDELLETKLLRLVVILCNATDQHQIIQIAHHQLLVIYRDKVASHCSGHLEK